MKTYTTRWRCETCPGARAYEVEAQAGTDPKVSAMVHARDLDAATHQHDGSSIRPAVALGPVLEWTPAEAK